MSASRQLTLLGFFLLAAAFVIKVAQLAFTPELYGALRVLVVGIISNVVIQALVVTAIFALLVTLITASWERSTRRHARWQARLEAEHAEREAHARSLRVQQEIEEATRHSGQSAA